MDIIYIRTSTEMQNPENQLKDCLSISPQEAKVFTETQSAWKDHINARPVFQEIYSLIKKREVRSITVWDLDRIYRKRVKTVEFMQVCRELGVKVQSFRQPYFKAIEDIPPPWNDIVRDQLIQILGWIAEEESNKKSDRVKIAFQNHSGKKWGRPKVEVNYYKIHQLKNSGMSIRKIASELGISKTKVGSVLKTSPENSRFV